MTPVIAAIEATIVARPAQIELLGLISRLRLVRISL